MKSASGEGRGAPGGSALLRRALLASIWLVAGYVVVSTTAGVLAARHPIPFQDHWETVFEHAAFAEGRFGLAELWAQHNEHRIVLPRLLFLADYAWGAGRGLVPVVAMLALHALLALLLAGAARSSWGSGRGLSAGYAGLASALAFWAAHKGNLIFPFQVAMSAALVPAALAFACAAAAVRDQEREPGRARRRLVLACLCALVASLSLASGVLAWPLVAGLCLLGRARPRALLATLGLGLALTVVYLLGYRSPAQHAGPLAALSDPLFVLRYLARYLGSPLGQDLRLARELLGGLGLVGFLALAALLAREIRARRRALDPAGALGLGLGCFVLGTAFLSSLGRRELGLDSAMSPRYETFGTAFWCALPLLAGALLEERLARSGKLALASLALLAACSALVAWRQTRELGELRGAHHWLDESALALACGVIDEENALRLYSLPEKLVSGDALLRRRELSIYAEAWWRAVGGRLGELFPTSDQRRAGEVRTVPLACVDGRRASYLQGWCSALGSEPLAGPILVCDAEGLVVGLGRLRPLLPASRGWIAWSGFARGQRAPSELRVWALGVSGEVSLLGDAPP